MSDDKKPEVKTMEYSRITAPWEFRLDSSRMGMMRNNVDAIFYLPPRDDSYEPSESIITSFNNGIATATKIDPNDDIPAPTMRLSVATLRNMYKNIEEFFDKEGLKAKLGNALEAEIEGLKAQLDSMKVLVGSKEDTIEILKQDREFLQDIISKT